MSQSLANPKEMYTSITALSNAKAIPKTILSEAKRRNADGFISNGNINWTELEPWLALHRQEIEDSLNDSLEYYKKESAKRDVQLKDLEIQKRKGEYLEPQQVKDFLSRIATQQNALFVARMKELPPKLTGKSVQDIDTILKETVQEICNVFSTELAHWKE